MKILFVAGEGSPYIKTGGLADVVGALPKALIKLGLEVDVILPKYSKINTDTKQVFDYEIGMDGQSYPVTISFDQNVVTTYFVENEYFYHRGAVYGEHDDDERFGLFNLAVLEFLKLKKYDVVHVHDWQAGILPHLINQNKSHKNLKKIKTFLTIHNLAYQGSFDLYLHQKLGLSYDSVYEMDHRFNYLKAAIMSVDAITTVSPTYRDEILTSDMGQGLNQVLSYRQEDLYGIVNGIDYNEYSPIHDASIAMTYTSTNVKEGKLANKRSIQKQFKLPEKAVPLFGFVSRLAHQKGIELVIESLYRILPHNDVQFIMLGSGDLHYEEQFRQLKRAFPTKVGIEIGYNEKLAHNIYAGSDYFLMPSLFEPCGLAQLISLKYGTLPIVRETGGLKDTIVPHFEKEGTGIVFKDFDTNGLSWGIDEAITLDRNTRKKNKMVQNAMNADFSWNASAKLYADLYKKGKM